jgi:formylglycine-generating enzyme required for sulfatase activity
MTEDTKILIFGMMKDGAGKHNKIELLYWYKIDNEWLNHTSERFRESVSLISTVMHISFQKRLYYSQWKGCRLPTEFEWEIASDQM